MLRDVRYKRDRYILKVYENGLQDKIKLIYLKTLQTSGLDLPKDISIRDTIINDTKLSNNICRAKSKIFELAFCNDWDFFFTGTISPEKYDRNNLDIFYKDFSTFINNFNSRNNTKIKYLFIPEHHKNGAWHLHGLIKGLPLQYLKEFSVNEHLPYYILNKINSGFCVFDWVDYSSRFGFNDLEYINSLEAVSKYITKYCTKDLSQRIKDIGAHLYYCSKGLNRSRFVKKGIYLGDNDSIKWDYENDFCKVVYLPYSNGLLNVLKESLVDV